MMTTDRPSKAGLENPASAGFLFAGRERPLLAESGHSKLQYLLGRMTDIGESGHSEKVSWRIVLE